MDGKQGREAMEEALERRGRQRKQVMNEALRKKALDEELQKKILSIKKKPENQPLKPMAPLPSVGKDGALRAAGREVQARKTGPAVISENKPAGQASTVLGNMRTMLKNLEAEIRADEESEKEMGRHIMGLELEEKQLLEEIARDEAFLSAMASEGSLGGAMKDVDKTVVTLQSDYHTAREKHGHAIKILENTFNYHRAYKRGNEVEFSGTYFNPKRDPNKHL